MASLIAPTTLPLGCAKGSSAMPPPPPDRAIPPPIPRAAAAPPPVPSTPPPADDAAPLAKGDDAWYYDASRGVWSAARIAAVHYDDLTPYYTVHVDGRERETEGKRLRHRRAGSLPPSGPPQEPRDRSVRTSEIDDDEIAT